MFLFIYLLKQKLPIAPPNAIFHLKELYQNDKSPDKVDVGIGAYRTEEGKPYYFKVVRKAEEIVLNDPSYNKEYLPIAGFPAFREASRKFLLGEDAKAIKENRVCTVQGLSGTGALFLGAAFLAKCCHDRKVYIPNVTWENHRQIFNTVGMAGNVCEYRYYDAKSIALDLKGLLEDLEKAPDGSIILFHTCAHNPTGVDPTPEEWEKIADLCIKKHFIPFFDTAYQGFASGDLVKDATSVRLFEKKGIEFLASQSYAKNMGLYNERIGAINVVCKSEKAAKAVQSEIELVVRPDYSNPPSHGAFIVAKILTTPELFKEWNDEVKMVSSRIIKMRKLLKENLEKIGAPGKWDHITKQIGMFSFTGLDADQSQRMIDKHHIYMLKNGRISIPGLRDSNVEYVAKAIKEVVDWKAAGKK